MRTFLALLVLGWALPATSLAQDAPAAANAVDPYIREEFQRLAGRLQDLEEAYNALSRRNRELENTIDALRAALRESNENLARRTADTITREDLKKTVDNIATEVDRKRESDRKAIIEEIKRLADKVTAPPVVAAPKEREKPVEKPLPSKTTSSESGEFYPHVVERGQNLSVILQAYNARFKEMGKKSVTLDQVQKANPKININNIYVGQEILIPVPAEKAP